MKVAQIRRNVTENKSNDTIRQQGKQLAYSAHGTEAENWQKTTKEYTHQLGQEISPTTTSQWKTGERGVQCNTWKYCTAAHTLHTNSLINGWIQQVTIHKEQNTTGCNCIYNTWQRNMSQLWPQMNLIKTQSVTTCTKTIVKLLLIKTSLLVTGCVKQIFLISNPNS